MPVNRSALLLLATAILADPVAAAAQAATAPAPGSPVNAWLSLGLGPGEFHTSSGTSFRARATVSHKRAALMYRKTGSLEGFDGPVDHNESSVLAGLRFGGKNLFVIPAIGFGQAHWHDDLCTAHISCTPEVAAQYDSKGSVLAYDFGIHANKVIAGLAGNITGTVGPKRNLLAMVLSVELGWFGR